MDYTWRWFGPDDPVSLADVRQAGATGIVTALHQIPNGALWPVDAIRERQSMIAAAGLRWQVVESIPVPEAIKLGTSGWQELADIWAASALNLAKCGIMTICYNFMPVLDWTRTRLRHVMDDGAECLRFDRVDLALFDLFILKRAGAAADYNTETHAEAERRFATMDADARTSLTDTILAGLPGSEESYTLDGFRAQIGQYRDINAEQLRLNLRQFLQHVVPQLAPAGVRLAIHPDDPPRALFGLPRVVSTADDLDAIVQMHPDPANGFTFCAGSLGVRADNDLPAILRKHAARIYFLHLRNTLRDPVSALSDGVAGESFQEAAHLDGNANMAALVAEILRIEAARGHPLPFRPDHGHALQSDLRGPYRPGYSAVGRLRGMAEIRGIEHALKHLKTT
ncbi:mannonate dehydratase [Roseinatronobacter alkalisoli]|uniref:Mannonate dehydratase n=1 Tax=Roseinatronobacter alkalisoli TaxID=3028235 RepID=A0ABT5T7L6_9RHOB|nr:mannonate dehydratase [Roseinatronobacter sp. HJB301]MDD7971049.1 mannonate dehydratase [Roseinatronobacter sp. HJB301]